MKTFVIALCLVALAVAALLVYTGQSFITVIWLVFNGCVILGAVLFERWRYKPNVDRSRGRWQRTGERFVDPTSGKLTDVYYNPDTGERDYVAVDAGGTHRV